MPWGFFYSLTFGTARDKELIDNLNFPLPLESQSNLVDIFQRFKPGILHRSLALTYFGFALVSFFWFFFFFGERKARTKGHWPNKSSHSVGRFPDKTDLKDFLWAWRKSHTPSGEENQKITSCFSNSSRLSGMALWGSEDRCRQALVGRGKAKLGAQLPVLSEPRNESCFAVPSPDVRSSRRLQDKWPHSRNLEAFRSLVRAGASLGTAVLDR